MMGTRSGPATITLQPDPLAKTRQPTPTPRRTTPTPLATPKEAEEAEPVKTTEEKATQKKK